MSWISDEKLSFPQRVAVRVTLCGPCPNHVAFIMDGNRRFATKSNIEKCDGHSLGYEKLSQVLHWCLTVGIREVTLYAFSIENFKRSEKEVNTLMKLAREKFKNVVEERDNLNEKGVKIIVIGNLSLLPLDLQKTLAETMLLTKDNKELILNIAFSYTSRDEITNSMKTIVNGIETNDITPDDVDELLISKCLYTKHGTEPDLLIRTSGETRLSDFLLWQTTKSVIYFTEVLWPEFSIWQLLAAIFLYQKHYFKIIKSTSETLRQKPSIKVNKFLNKVEENDLKMLTNLSKLIID